MSSNLVKAFNVVAKLGQKVVGAPDYVMMVEETTSILVHNHEIEEMEQMQETLIQQKEQAQQELVEWRQIEEERFLKELEEEKRRGYEEGYQLGIKDGTEHAEQLQKVRLQKAADVLEQAYLEKTAVIKEAEPFVIELTMEIAKKVIQQELKTHPEELIHIIKQTLATVYETDSLSIGVAPTDFAFVQKQRQQLLAVDNGQMEIKVFPDYSIEQGGCIIRTSSGSVDARIDVQLSEIKKVLLSLQQEDHCE